MDGIELISPTQRRCEEIDHNTTIRLEDMDVVKTHKMLQRIDAKLNLLILGGEPFTRWIE